jgi:hypothetical protein
LLKCLGKKEAKMAMGEVHDGMCGTHYAVPKMRWALRRVGVYWPTMLDDCFKYYRGCESCQKFRPVHIAPASMMHPIVKSWPFRGWGLDFIGEIHPTSTKRHRFLLMATDYLYMGGSCAPTKHDSSRLCYGAYSVLVWNTTYFDDRSRSSLYAWQFKEFSASLGIKLLNSSPQMVRQKLATRP